MKKHTEKPPIDELFARKLGNMSMPPSADGFSRLQARMGHQQPDTKLVFWRNPTIQRSMAAAACLLLVSLFGWLYWPSGGPAKEGETQLAANRSAKSNREEEPKRTLPVNERQKTENDSEPVVSESANTDQLVLADSKEDQAQQARSAQTQSEAVSVDRQPYSRKSTPSVAASANGAVMAQAKPVDNKPQHDATTPAAVAPVNTPDVSTERLADTKASNKPSAPAERVLEVTIAEPEALVAARQAARNAVAEKVAVAQNDKPEKEAKPGNLWQQVKRIKQGEVFARQDDANADESGLLGRAYAGLKHSLDKDKPAKQ